MIEVPDGFREMSRWWSDGATWMDALPGLVAAQCATWNLQVDGPLAWGSHALVIPVTRGSDQFVLRMNRPGPEVDALADALRWWDGRGMVYLYDVDAAAGAMLLERLTTPLATRPLDEAMAVLGQVMRRLAVPPKPEARSTGEIVRQRLIELEQRWEEGERPFDVAFLRMALEIGPRLVEPASDLSVNGDLHVHQVLAGAREPWITVDPLLYRGDIEYDLGRVLWMQLDEMTEIPPYFEIVVQEAGLVRDRARDWAVFRAVSYWSWGLANGLTEDPVRCERLLKALL
ncbi:kinase [Kribbella antibiotica]|uniref:Kinase n=1 Tax=Kribbella antibiotica TaxID=190195 RepID=A0A4R4ZI64_9ACTN|nr:aminoglycoside phosphotransferase family protein [Kribbella antibiotica]TDD56312.1 kinase [Kribbella antibiotica]